MSPILRLGFSLALFDFSEMRRSLTALAIGAVAAIIFTSLIVEFSPLQAPTAGTFAIIQGRGDTILGVATATALMPPLAVVGYGLATWNMPILAGAFALFVTNFVTIALPATVMARFYGFGHHLSSQQSWTQTFVLLFVFIVMAVPLGISVRQIAGETVTLNQTRTFLAQRFGADARITQLDIDFDSTPLVVRAVVIAPRTSLEKAAGLQQALADKLAQPLKLRLDQVVLEPGAGAIDARQEELRQAGEAAAIESRRIAALSQVLALTAGIASDGVTIDREHHRAMATAVPLPGASLATYRALERRIAEQAQGWDIVLTPPQMPLPPIGLIGNGDQLDPPSREAVLTSAWAAKRWNVRTLAVPGLPETGPETPSVTERRALTIPALLRENGITPTSAPASGSKFSLQLGNASEEGF